MANGIFALGQKGDKLPGGNHVHQGVFHRYLFQMEIQWDVFMGIIPDIQNVPLRILLFQKPMQANGVHAGHDDQRIIVLLPDDTLCFFSIQKIKGNGKIPLPNLYKIDLIKSTYGNAYV